MSAERPFVCRWRELMAETDLPANAKLVLHTIALNFDSLGKGAHPSLDTIARRASLDRSTVKRHLKLVTGWLDQRKGNGRGLATEYTAKIPERTVIELANALGRRSVSRPNMVALPRQKGAQDAPLSSQEWGALCAQRGRTVPPQLDPKLERERRTHASDGKGRAIRVGEQDIAGPGFTVPRAAIDRLAQACGIDREQAHAITEAEAHEWAANDTTPDHIIAYLRTVFTSHRDSTATIRGKTGRPAVAASHRDWPSLPAGPQPLTERRQVELVSDFFEHGEWFPKLRDALGPPPGEPGCFIASHIIEKARELVPFPVDGTMT